MGQLSDDFDLELAGLRARYRHAPRDEINKLLLLALEREQLVAVAYADDQLGRRLAALPIDEPARRLIRHALAWACKDEEMHAVYIRGLLLRVGSLRVRGLAIVGQAAGAIGGWASAVRQHRRFHDAPLAFGIATVVTRCGQLLGKVPAGIAADLRLQSFSGFCRLQIDAERTAAHCWQRLTELAKSYPGLDDRTAREFEHMWRDEERHERVFAIVHGALDDGDRMRPEGDAATLAARLGEVSPFFLPRELRAGELAANPIGSGGRVWVHQSEADADKRRALRGILDAAGLDRIVGERAAASGRPCAELRVVIKASFMLAYDRCCRSIFTDPELVDELARYLRVHGCRDIIVGEGRTLYEQYHARRSVVEVAEYAGYASDAYRVVDLSDEQVPHSYPRGMAQETVARSWRDADLRISFAKLRSHPIDLSHLTIGGSQGIGALFEDYMFADRQAHRDTALLMPLAEFPAHFGLIDGFDSAADGVVGVIGCAHPPRPRRLYAARDLLALDLVATRHMGIRRPRDSKVLDSACHWFGDPTAATEVVGLDAPLAGWRHPYHSEWSSLLSLLAHSVWMLASRRGRLFLPPMDAVAFPPLARDGIGLRLARAVVRRLVGLNGPR